ncbi:MAG TPA: hypothetical protein ENI76_02400 [Ignavibacteria bacterium]|nr:hypothetical protein [Ignavibacteria bacterium]
MNKFIEALFRISDTYVRYRYYQINKILKKGSLSVEDIAIEAIVPLFYQGKDKSNFVITDKVKEWTPKIEYEEAALFFLNKIIAKRVEQYISSLLRQSDPFFSRILDAVNYLIRTQSYKKTYYLGKIYIIENDEVISSEVIDENTFNVLPSSLFIDKKNLLFKIMTYIKSETDYFPAILCNELVLRLKQLNFSGFKKHDESLDDIEEIELDEIIKAGLKSTINKLKNSYFDTNKLTEKKYTVFKKALTDMAEDLKNGGVSPGLYKYLQEYQPDMSVEKYHNDYHNILEYLLRTLKTNIAEELRVN